MIGKRRQRYKPAQESFALVSQGRGGAKKQKGSGGGCGTTEAPVSGFEVLPGWWLSQALAWQRDGHPSDPHGGPPVFAWATKQPVTVVESFIEVPISCVVLQVVPLPTMVISQL